MAGNTGVLEVSLVQTLDGKTYTNQLHYMQEQGDPSATSLILHAAQHAAGVKEKWDDYMKPLTTSSLSLTEIKMRYLSETHRFPDIPPAPVGTPTAIGWSVAEEAVDTTGLPAAGAVTGQYLPAFNAFRARKISAKPGRRGRGHNSFPGVPESESAGNILESGDWSTWQTNAPLLLGVGYSFTSGSVLYRMLPVVLSLTQAQATGVVPQVAWVYAYEVTSVVPNRLIGTMRRRKKKVV